MSAAPAGARRPAPCVVPQLDDRALLGNDKACYQPSPRRRYFDDWRWRKPHPAAKPNAKTTTRSNPSIAAGTKWQAVPRLLQPSGLMKVLLARPVAAPIAACRARVPAEVVGSMQRAPSVRPGRFSRCDLLKRRLTMNSSGDIVKGDVVSSCFRHIDLRMPSYKGLWTGREICLGDELKPEKIPRSRALVRNCGRQTRLTNP